MDCASSKAPLSPPNASADPLTAEPDIARVTHPLLELFRGSQPGEYGFPVTLPRNSTLTVALGRRHLRATEVPVN